MRSGEGEGLLSAQTPKDPYEPVIAGSVTVAALFVATGGCYFGLDGVDPWDQARDARQYAGPHPVVAHPPCERWSSMNNLVLCRYPDRAEEFAHGNDGGCFAAALAAVRAHGGVLEHPAYSRAWRAFDLPAPARHWQRGLCGGWSIEVDQAAWGHPARKKTWLYAFGVSVPAIAPKKPVAASGKFVRVYRKRLPDGTWKRMTPYGTTSEVTHRAARATPPEFRDLLLSIARSPARTAAPEAAMNRHQMAGTPT